MSSIKVQTYHDSKRSPYLPLHDQCPSYRSGCTLRRVNRHCRGLGADSESKYKTRDEKILPRLNNAFPNGSHSRNKTRHEDGPTSAEDMVQRLGHPTAKNGTREIRSPHDETSDVVDFTLAA